MTRVCAWCRRDLGTFAIEESGVSHGICDVCVSRFDDGMPITDEMRHRNEMIIVGHARNKLLDKA